MATMRFLFKRSLVVAVTLGLTSLLAMPAKGAVTYVVTVDTSSVNGTSGYLDLQFNPGNAGSQPATARVSRFASSDGSFSGAPAIIGNVTGTLPSAVTLVNSGPLNDYFHQFTYGSTFSFLVTLSGPAVDAPNGTATATSTFGLGLYDGMQTPILTNDASGNAGKIDINLDGTTTAIANPTESDDPTVVTFKVRQIDPLRVRYFSNLTAGDSVIDITNTGINGVSLFGPGLGPPVGNLCINVYTFSPDEQLVACCSCLITPSGLVHLTANNDLVSNTLTGIRPNSIVVKLVTTGAGENFTGAACANSAALAGTLAFPLASGALAWGTTLHSASNVDPVPAGSSFSITETPFLPATLGAEELKSLTSRCTNIVGNGSTFGQCKSCHLGGLGGSKL